MQKPRPADASQLGMSHLPAGFFTLSADAARWGDYGITLFHGDAAEEVSRIGPFVPPLAAPYSGELIVTAEFREVLKREFKGLRFRRAKLSHAVRLDWHLWDETADAPKKYPPDFEPEGYLDGKHDVKLARSMPELWALVLPRVALEGPWPHALQRVRGWEIVIASREMKKFITAQPFSAWFEFKPLAVFLRAVERHRRERW